MSKKTIQVAGDVCIDVLGVAHSHISADANPKMENWRLTGEIRTSYRFGGTFLLRDMVRAAAARCEVLGPELITPPALHGRRKPSRFDDQLIERLTRQEIVHSVLRIDEFKKNAKAEKEKILRVKTTEGFSGPAKGDPTIDVRPPKSERVDIVVLDDTGNGFRAAQDQWPKAVKVRNNGKSPLILHKLHRPLPLPSAGGGAVGGGKDSTLWKTLLRNYPEQRVVVVSVDDLRDDDVPISKGLSWERTALDLVWHLVNLPRWQALKNTPHLIVRLGLDGALYWRSGKDDDGKDKFRAWLIYDPAGIEGSWEATFEGSMVAYGSAFTAGLAAELARQRNARKWMGSPDGNGIPKIIAGIRAGLNASRRLLRLGFGPDRAKPAYPFGDLFQEDANDKLFACQEIPIIPEATVPDRGYWRLIESIFKEKTKFLHRAVAMVAKESTPPDNAPENEDKDAGRLLKQVPVAVFADLRAYDRREIECYRAVYSVMSDYVRQQVARRPLNLAVFGPPGAGKSFGVKQVAKALEQSGSRAIETLTFNLSQYRSPDELAAAFHLVRDVVLRGKVPLVFFDEFDTALADTPLGWLRYFLSPMQDAEFLDRGTPHPIGQSIFVFAGGTCGSYEEFARPFLRKDDSGFDSEKVKDFRDSKGPDFLSRLRGTLDIPGLDLYAEYDAYGPTEAFPCEAAILLRRANILASQLKEKAPGLADAGKTLQVSEPVIRALLHLPKFAHGNRSFEALLDISHLAGQTRFTPSLLPSNAHAALHANAGQLMQLLAKDYPYPDKEREKIAEAVHRAYLKTREKEGPLDPTDRSTREWKVLDEDLKESNRQQADHIAIKLRAIGLWFRKAISGIQMSGALERYFQSNVERLARAEHDRWVAEKRRAGWIPASDMKRESRDRFLLRHNFIFEWDQLDDSIKDLDRNAVRKIPELLRAGGYEVYRPIDNDVSLPKFEA